MVTADMAGQTPDSNKYLEKIIFRSILGHERMKECITMLKDYGTNRIKRSGTLLILLSMIVLLLMLSGCGSGGESNYSITGAITSGGAPLAGVTLTLSSGPSAGASVTDANGHYSFGSLSSGTYTLTPSLAGYTFVPTARTVYLYGNNAEGFNFSASRGISMSTSTHTLYRKSDGTVWAWGKNDKGQLGDGTTTPSSNPLQVSGLSGITAVAAGNEHSLVLKSDRTVWAWGSNNFGQLGDNSTTDRPAPVQVSGLTSVTAIAAGVNFSLALKSDGTVWAWGYNGSGQLGNGTTNNSSTPVQVSGLVSATAIAAGFDHCVVMTSVGVIWTWGNNSNGQLGNGGTINSSTPVAAGSGILAGPLAISAGNQFSVALLSNYLSSYLWAWGINSSGQLGNGTNTDSSTPVQVSGSTNMIAIAAGQNHSVSLKNDGTVWAWGSNNDGQLGDGTTTPHSTPVQVSGLTGGQAVTVGYQDTFVATSSVGTVWAWGDNSFGQLGDGTTTPRLSPVSITLP
jgi:alpha-tubulin suppressor-like RCC1 family protein